MRRKCAFFIFLLACWSLVLAGYLSNAYQTGRIVLRLDPVFAQKVDWAKIFPVRTEYASTAEHSLLAVASDGTSFVLNGITSQISKFSPTGDLLLTWGKRGRKPGEFPSQPRSLMLMDDRYVLAADTSMGQVNMYDWNGKFLRMLQVKFPIYQMVQLVRGKFAISSSIGLPGWKTKRFAAIINLDEGKEKIVAAEIEEIEMDHDKRARSFISRTREGNLVVAVSNKPELAIFSPDGRQLGRIALNIDNAFNNHYFTRLSPDAAGNTLVFKHAKDDQQQFQVYQLEGGSGNMVAEIGLEGGALGSFENLGAVAFQQNFLYAIANLKQGEADGWRLIRAVWVAAVK